MAVSGELVAVLDAGAQYGKLIDRRVRELSVETVLLPLGTPAAEVAAGNYKAVIISGGPHSVYAADAPAFDPEVLSLGVPVGPPPAPRPNANTGRLAARCHMVSLGSLELRLTFPPLPWCRGGCRS